MTSENTDNWIQAGRVFTPEEVSAIRDTVGWLPGLPRKEISATVCEHLHWHTASGSPKIQACQKLLERLEQAGLLELPPLQRRPGASGPKADVKVTSRTANIAQLSAPLHTIDPVYLEVVAESSEVKLWNEYVERFHLLGYKGAFGFRLRYFIRSGTRYLGCILLAGAAKAIAVRDDWIGWDAQTRLANLPRIINNSRFLIFPQIAVPHLASHVLAKLARRVTADWQHHWGFTPLLLETFVDPARFTGACYLAAGWELLGETSGRGLPRPGHTYRSTPRLVLVKPLTKDFRQQLCAPPIPAIEEQ